MNPSEALSFCMAVPRRYRNYNEQTQAEMDRFYGNGNSDSTQPQPTYMDYEQVKKEEPAKSGSEEQEYMPNVLINGKPATPRAAGVFMTLFGAAYMLFSLFMGSIMFVTDAPLFAFLIIAVFVTVGAFITCIGIYLLRKSSR